MPVMRNWIPVYRSKYKRPWEEAWQCKTCGGASETGFTEGPKDGKCNCEACMISIPSRTYAKGWERIWGGNIR